ncbi:MAG: branched-chain amino acid ABC transporter permease, partial [Candidatus Promineifilaceae bacterium]
MPTLTRPSHKYGTLIGWLLPVLFILIPYLFAVVTGTPEEGLTGLAKMHSTAESVYCEDGRTPVAVIFTAELGLMLLAVVAASAARKRIPAVLTEAFQNNGWHVLTFMLLIAIPFFIAWQTETSVCTRGRAFFWQSIFIDTFILAILALSYNLMFGFAGVISFGHAAFFGMGAYTVGLVMSHLGWAWWLAVLTALLVGVVIALIKGFIGLRIKGLYFALFTLAFAEVFFILAGNRILADITGAEDGFTFDVPDFLNVTQNRLFFYYLALMAMVVAFLVIRRLMNSPTGRVLHALRENEERAQMLGYNTFYFKLIAIIVAGILASGAGVLRGIALKGASPNVLSLDFTITPLLMVIVGGLGTYAGPAVGAFTLHLLEQFLRDTVVTIGGTEINIGERWALILGIVFILIVMVFPQGIVGTWYN